jgi:hypothetical protein
MIRAIGVPWARAMAFEMLCTSFREERDENLRFVIANALSGMARFDEVRELPGTKRTRHCSPNVALHETARAGKLFEGEYSSGQCRC